MTEFDEAIRHLAKLLGFTFAATILVFVIIGFATGEWPFS